MLFELPDSTVGGVNALLDAGETPAVPVSYLSLHCRRLGLVRVVRGLNSQ